MIEVPLSKLSMERGAVEDPAEAIATRDWVCVAVEESETTESNDRKGDRETTPYYQ